MREGEIPVFYGEITNEGIESFASDRIYAEDEKTLSSYPF